MIREKGRAERHAVRPVAAGGSRGEEVVGRAVDQVDAGRRHYRRAVDASPARSPPTLRPSVVGGRPTPSRAPVGELDPDGVVARGKATVPSAVTRAATRVPSAAAVQTGSPSFRSVTRTGPVGVSMRVAAARQIGQLGRPGWLEVTLTLPLVSTLPATVAVAVRTLKS